MITRSRLASLMLISSAIIWSFIVWIGGGVVIPFFGQIYRTPSMVELRALIPAITLLACDHLAVIIVLLATVCVAGLAALWRFPGRQMQFATAGLCGQWLVVWVAAFCFCYDGFLGHVSMHHAQEFDPRAFISSGGGIFPISMALIVMTFAASLWPLRNEGR